MANHLMKYRGSRGSEFRTYIGRFWCLKCKMMGYAEDWYTNVGNHVISVKHTGKVDGEWKTIKRCWL